MGDPPEGDQNVQVPDADADDAAGDHQAAPSLTSGEPSGGDQEEPESQGEAPAAEDSPLVDGGDPEPATEPAEPAGGDPGKLSPCAPP